MGIVVPYHNEADSLANLASNLFELEAALACRYMLELLLVDDGSTDETWRLLHSIFGGWPKVQLVRHETNRGIAAAIATGLLRARAEIVASLDADCTYHPLQLLSMLPLLTKGVDLVVASAYHPRGKVPAGTRECPTCSLRRSPPGCPLSRRESVARPCV